MTIGTVWGDDTWGSDTWGSDTWGDVAAPLVSGSVFPENVFVEILTTPGGVPTWTNISADIVTPIKCNLGFGDGGTLSRLAPGSDMRFDIFNPTGVYDPSTSFYKGQKIRLRIKWGSFLKVKFFGYIDHIGLDVGTWGNRQAHVVCIDWLGLAAKTPVRALEGITNTTIDAAVRALLAQMQMQPEALDLEVGDIVMPSVFDQVTPNSTIYSELQNLVMGEWGYIYMRDGGMTLKVENSTSRTGDGSDYKTFPYYINDGTPEDFLLPDGTNFLLPDGTNFLLPGEPTTRTFDSDFGQDYTNIAINHGDELINKISVSAVPVIVGASVAVLYPFDIASGSKAFVIAANSIYTLQGQYKDPTAGGAQISGSDIITPVVTTDWNFNSLKTGLGTDLSANITIAFTKGQSGFKAVIKNNGAAGWITKFNVRGVPIYRYSPVETVISDERSVWDYGDYALQFTRQYGASSDDIRPFIFRLLMRNKQPRTIFSNPKFNAFDEAEHLAGFLALDIGDQIRLTSTRPASDDIHYIQGVKFQILPGNELITFEYITTETIAGEILGVTECAIEQVTGTQQNLDFGYLPTVAGNHPQRTITARVYLSSAPTFQTDRVIISIVDRFALLVKVDPSVYLTFYFNRSTAAGVWRGPITFPYDEWVNVAVTYDSSSDANNPILYINGSSVAVIELPPAPSGTALDETGYQLILGNYSKSTALNDFPFTGKYQDVTEYNRILTPAEITTIHNAGTRLPFISYPKTGLRFFFGGVDSTVYTEKLDSALDLSNVVYDLWSGFPGQPTENPTLRAVG